jgi:hypothetical protein
MLVPSNAIPNPDWLVVVGARKFLNRSPVAAFAGNASPRNKIYATRKNKRNRLIREIVRLRLGRCAKTKRFFMALPPPWLMTESYTRSGEENTGSRHIPGRCKS